MAGWLSRLKASEGYRPVEPSLSTTRVFHLPDFASSDANFRSPSQPLKYATAGMPLLSMASDMNEYSPAASGLIGSSTTVGEDHRPFVSRTAYMSAPVSRSE